MYITKVKYAPGVGLPNLVALDPGKTIGVAVAEGRQENGYTWTYEIETYHYLWPTSVAVQDLDLIIAGADVVTAENFKIYAHKAQSLAWDGVPAARVLGFVEGTCLRHETLFTSYMASQAKTISTDKFLQEMMAGGTLPDNKHERDALRHMLVLLIKLPEIWKERNP